MSVLLDTPYLAGDLYRINLFSHFHHRQSAWDHRDVTRLLWYFYKRTVVAYGDSSERDILEALKTAFHEGDFIDIIDTIRIGGSKYEKALVDSIRNLLKGFFVFPLDVFNDDGGKDRKWTEEFECSETLRKHLAVNAGREEGNVPMVTFREGAYHIIKTEEEKLQYASRIKGRRLLFMARFISDVLIEFDCLDCYPFIDNPNITDQSMFCLLPAKLISDCIPSFLAATETGLLNIFTRLVTPHRLFVMINQINPTFFQMAINKGNNIICKPFSKKAEGDAWAESLLLAWKAYCDDIGVYTIYNLITEGIMAMGGPVGLADIMKQGQLTTVTKSGYVGVLHACHILVNDCRDIVTQLDKESNLIKIPYAPNEQFSTMVGLHCYRRDFCMKAILSRGNICFIDNVQSCGAGDEKKQSPNRQCQRKRIFKYSKYASKAKKMFWCILPESEQGRKMGANFNCPECSSAIASNIVAVGFQSLGMKALVMLLAAGLAGGQLFAKAKIPFDAVVDALSAEVSTKTVTTAKNSLTRHASCLINRTLLLNSYLRQGPVPSGHGVFFDPNCEGDPYFKYDQDVRHMSYLDEYRVFMEVATAIKPTRRGPNSAYSHLHASDINDFGNRGMSCFKNGTAFNTNRVYVNYHTPSLVTKPNKPYKTLHVNMHKNDKGGSFSHFANRVNGITIQRTNNCKGDAQALLYSDAEARLSALIDSPFSYLDLLNTSPGIIIVNNNNCVDHHGITNMSKIPNKMIESGIGVKASNFPAIQTYDKITIEFSTALPIKHIQNSVNGKVSALLPSNFHKCGTSQYSKASDPYYLQPLVAINSKHINELAEVDQGLKRIGIAMERANGNLLTYRVSRFVVIFWEIIRCTKLVNDDVLASDLVNSMINDSAICFSRSNIGSAGKQCTHLCMGAGNLSLLEKTPKTVGFYGMTHIKDKIPQLGDILSGHSSYFKSRKGNFQSLCSCGGMELMRGESHEDMISCLKRIYLTRCRYNGEHKETLALLKEIINFYS